MGQPSLNDFLLVMESVRILLSDKSKLSKTHKTYEDGKIRMKESRNDHKNLEITVLREDGNSEEVLVTHLGRLEVFRDGLWAGYVKDLAKNQLALNPYKHDRINLDNFRPINDEDVFKRK